MKKASAAFATPLLCGLLLAGIPAVGAQIGTITVPLGDVEYVVERYDDGDNPSYEVSFNDFDVDSVYQIDQDGFVQFFYAGTESYRIKYRGNGELKNVKRLTNRRQLEAEQGAADMTQAVVVGETTPPASGARRRLFECGECLQTWDTVCDNGVDTVCNLEGHRKIRSSGDLSVGLFCNDFGSLCNQFTADDVCEEECGGGECQAPLTITLQYEYLGYSGSYTGGYGTYTGGYGSYTGSGDFSLDLYVIEPEGQQTAYWNNGQTDLGYMSTLATSTSYTMFSGLDPGAVTGPYLIFVDWYTGIGPISWTVTATTGSGDVVFEDQGEFNDDCGSSTTALMSVFLHEYVDNGCEDGGDGFTPPFIKSHGS